MHNRPSSETYIRLFSSRSFLPKPSTRKNSKTNQEKTKILNTVLGEFGQPLVSELVSHFEGSQALHQLQDVTNLFDQRYKEGKNIVSVEGTVASELEESEIVSLKSSLSLALEKTIDLSLKVDESLVGGIRLRIENTFLDATIQNQLYTLKQELVES